MFKSTWTEEELAMLANHKVPPTRSENAARNKACRLHIPFNPGTPDAEPSVLPEHTLQRTTWTAEEVASLRKGTLPEGRSRQSAYDKACRLHVPFNPVRRQKVPQKEKVATLYSHIVQELQATGNIRATSRKFGVSYTAVRNIALELAKNL